jgi:hypothetical protein
LSEEPALVLGAVDGTSSQVFHDIRGAVTAPDGQIVVADGASNQLRVFSSTGEFVRSFGRYGDGPAEFRGIEWIDMCGGAAVVAYDFSRFRITKWDVRGVLLEDFLVEGPGPLPPYAVSCGPTGAFAVIGWHDVKDSRIKPGAYRPQVAIGISDAEGHLERVVGTFLGTERFKGLSNDRPHPFGKSTVARLGHEAVYVGTADSFAVQIVAPDGSRRSLGRDRAASGLTSQVREEWVDWYVRRAPEERRPSLKRTILDSDLVPTSLPAYSDVQLDRLGFVWIAEYVIADPRTKTWADWDVFDPAGAFLATVRVPLNFRPTEIGRDYLLGVSTDDLGVQRVHRYTLWR